METKLVVTGDGSTSLFIPDLDEHYHSIHGAIQESMHVFIHAGLKPLLASKKEIQILEIGFGTGLNALLTAIESMKQNVAIQYTTIEKYPISPEFITQLNFCSLVDDPNCSNWFKKIHDCEWEQMTAISQNFFLKKIKADFKTIEFTNAFDVLYYDAFAPSAQPELWTEDIFKIMYKALKKEGILVTYCAKGIVKRTMKSVGFEVVALPGPPGKREMTKAIKHNDENQI